MARSSVPRYDAITRGLDRTSVGRPLGDHRTGFEAVDAVADGQDQGQVVLDDDQGGVELGLDPLDQRPEGLGLALGHAGGGLVQADDRRGGGQEGGQFDDPAGARRQLGHEAVGVATEAQEVDQLGRLAAPPAARARVERGRKSRVPQNDVACAGLEGQLDDLADGELGEERGGLEGASQSQAGPLMGLEAADVVAEQLDPAAWRGRSRRWR